MSTGYFAHGPLPGGSGVFQGHAAALDETTILRFRRLLERHELCGKILDTANHYLASKGMRISTDTSSFMPYSQATLLDPVTP
jgi:IS5 family transposase